MLILILFSYTLESKLVSKLESKLVYKSRGSFIATM